jgi:membrane dipeptidase
VNEKIKEARDVGLDILSPSAKDLEHGMELHRNSVVCDTYGFAPRSAIDGDAVQAAIESGASHAELQDMEEDMGMTRCVRDASEGREFREAWEEAGVTCIVQNAGEEGQDPQRLIKRLARFTFVADSMRDFLVRAVGPDDVVAAHNQGKHCFYMSGNGVPLSQQWVSVEEELRYIRIFYQLGIRIMHLTYNRRNMIGDGCAEPANGGLSDFGGAVVAEMNRVGVIVDVAHAGWQTSLEAARVSSVPMVASHSGCCAVNEHIRCKPDEVIRAIVDTDGYIGICCIPSFLGGTGDISAVLDHVDYVAKKFGVDRVTIGTDTAYASRAVDGERKKVSGRAKARVRWGGFWPEDAFPEKYRDERMVKSLAWTNWPLFTVGLVQRGYSDEDIQKILGGNMLRVARAVIDAGGAGWEE